MKQKHLYSLLDKTFCLVRVVFTEGAPQRSRPMTRDEMSKLLARTDVDSLVGKWVSAGAPISSNIRSFAYKVPRTWNVQVDEQLLVDTPNGGLKVAYVVEVDSLASIDPDADFDYKWAVQKIDRSEYDRLVAQEQKFQETMLEIERVRERETAMQKFRDHLPEGSEARRIFEDAVAQIAPPAPPAAPFKS
jgi:hypothetical protein